MNMTNHTPRIWLFGRSGLLIFLMVLFAASQAVAFFGGKITDFTADQVFIEPGGETSHTSKIYVSGDRYRMDGMPGPAGKSMDIAVIVFKDEQRQTMINKDKKLYYDGPVSDNMATMEKQMKASQEKGKVLGTETVSGFKCIKKEVESVFEMMGYKKVSKQIIWVSDRLEIPVRTQTDEGGISELRNIKNGVPDASLFEVPKGYTQVSSMMAVMGMTMPGSRRGQESGNATQGGSDGSGFKIPEAFKGFKMPSGKRE